MSNDIPSFGSQHLHPYQRTGGTSPQHGPAESARSDASADAEAAAPRATDDAQSLSPAEREMIERKFPHDPNLSMRLYGPNRAEQTVNPDVLGNNLDVRG